MQIRGTMKYHYLVKIKIIPNVIKDVEQLVLSDIAGGNVE